MGEIHAANMIPYFMFHWKAKTLLQYTKKGKIGILLQQIHIYFKNYFLGRKNKKNFEEKNIKNIKKIHHINTLNGNMRRALIKKYIEQGSTKGDN